MRTEPAGCEAEIMTSVGESSIETTDAAEADGSSSRSADERLLDHAHLAREVREFLVQKQIEDEVRKTISLAKEHFTIVGEPLFDIVSDPECGEHSVGIHVRAEGRPEQVFQQSEAFLDSFVHGIEPAKQRYINLVYHPTSD
jgi:hypothetical protein